MATKTAASTVAAVSQPATIMAKAVIAVAVVVEHGGAGSKSAAPIARDITLQALFKGKPPLEVYPAKDRTAVLERQKKLGEDLKELEMFRKNKV